MPIKENENIKNKIGKEYAIEELEKSISNSAFNKTFYNTNIPLKNFIKSLFPYTHLIEPENVKELKSIFNCVPEFQRENNKWNEEMQIKFIENIIMGFKPVLMFYQISNSSQYNPNVPAKIIDGLQRLTAIYRFFNGEIKAFGYSIDDLIKNKIISNMRQQIILNIYCFNNEKEAIKFYIEMNENITHSKEDIEKAKKYLNN